MHIHTQSNTERAGSKMGRIKTAERSCMGDDVFAALTFIGINACFSHEMDFSSLVDAWVKIGRKLPLPDADSSSVLKHLQSRESGTFMGKSSTCKLTGKSIYDSTSRALAPGRGGRGCGTQTHTQQSQRQGRFEQGQKQKQKQKQKQEQAQKQEQTPEQTQEQTQEQGQEQAQTQTQTQKQKQKQKSQQQQEQQKLKVAAVKGTVKKQGPKRGVHATNKQGKRKAGVPNPVQSKRKTRTVESYLAMGAEDNPNTGVGMLSNEVETFMRARCLRQVKVQADGHCLARSLGKEQRKQPGDVYREFAAAARQGRLELAAAVGGDGGGEGVEGEREGEGEAGERKGEVAA